MLPPWTPYHLSPSLAHLFASPRLSRQSNNLYLEATGPREAAAGEPKELAIVANYLQLLMGPLLAGCQRSLDKIVIKCNQKRRAIFHRIKIPGKLEIVGEG